jgi:acetylornithine deacetylase/succinyl-diaminopimelate desuccinylase-like protein
MDLNSPYMAAASRAYENGWGQKPVYERGGGTLPVLADFQRELNQIPIMLMGFGLQTDGAHGPNEHFVLEMFKRGIDTAICFFDEVGQIK